MLYRATLTYNTEDGDTVIEHKKITQWFDEYGFNECVVKARQLSEKYCVYNQEYTITITAYDR